MVFMIGNHNFIAAIKKKIRMFTELFFVKEKILSLFNQSKVL